MIEFVDLQVSNGVLSGTIQVKSNPCYQGVVIKRFCVNTQDTYNDNNPFASSIYESEDLRSEEQPVEFTLTAAQFNEEYRDIDMSKTIFFITAEGEIESLTQELPCGCDNRFSTGATFDLCPIYNETMAYVKEIDNTCVLPRNFINMILQLKAIQYSINSGHYTQAAEYYKKFYKNLSVGTKPCNCNG